MENVGRFRVTIKEYMPLTLSAERGTDAPVSYTHLDVYKRQRQDRCQRQCLYQL